MPRATTYFEGQIIRPELVVRPAQAAATSRDSIAEKLRRMPLFKDVAEPALVKLAARAHFRDYAPDEMVVDSGDASNEVFFIIEGAVRIVVRTANGWEAILNELGPGKSFGELAAIDGSHRSANVTALQRTRLCIVPADAFMELVLTSQEVGLRLLRMLAVMLRNKDERLIEFSLLSVRQRLISELLRLSRVRAGGEQILTPPPSQQVLAAWIGTRRESVSREMTDMANKGLLTKTKRSIVLHFPERLRAEIEAQTSSRSRTDGKSPSS